MIISFSGLDGAGKTTQIQMLLQNYQNIGASIGSIYTYTPNIRYHHTTELKNIYKKLSSFDVIHIRYRLNSDMNNFIMQRLESKAPQQHLLSVAAAIQGYLDHCELRDYVLNSLLEDNKILIFDRYYYDELAFKYTYGCPDFVLKKLYNNVLDADIKFYIQIPAIECLKRNRSRPDSKVVLYQNEDYINFLIERFNLIAKRKELITLNGMDTKEKISQSILKYVFPQS